jgi:hypothetical protein
MESDEREVAAHATATASAEVPRQRAAEATETAAGPAAATAAERAAAAAERSAAGATETAAEPAAAAACLLLGIVRMLRARERGYLAAVLHDGPIQELAAATLELSLARRAAEDDLGVAERQVEAAGRSLRRLVEDLTPIPQPGPGLAATLNRRTAWLLDTPLAVDLGEGAAGLLPAEVEAVADLVELMLLGAAGPDAPARALAAVRAERDLIVIELSMSATGDPAAAAKWLDRLAAAMRIGADIALRGHRLRARMDLPRQTPPAGGGRV